MMVVMVVMMIVESMVIIIFVYGRDGDRRVIISISPAALDS